MTVIKKEIANTNELEISDFKQQRKKLMGRNFFLYHFFRLLSNLGYRILSDSIAEIPAELKKIKYGKEKAVFFYVGLHRSLWETTGVLSALNTNGLPIPLVGMGDNLVKGKVFQKLARKTSLFFIKRAQDRRSLLESAKKFKNDIKEFLQFGIDILIFPEGTRKSIPKTGQYGQFFPTAFEALLECEKEKTAYSKNCRFSVYIIPFTVDYSIIREEKELTIDSQNPQTLNVFDSLKMLKRLRKIYVSFGSPIKTSECVHMNRKEMSLFIREKCLDLVKILPINVVAQAILMSIEDQQIKTDYLEDNIQAVLEQLKPYEDRFRNFSLADNAAHICNRIGHHAFKTENIRYSNLNIYKLYAGYIHHYLQ
jgi:1-acyl-sn-glycerol-3-phosphate acyltransferase